MLCVARPRYESGEVQLWDHALRDDRAIPCAFKYSRSFNHDLNILSLCPSEERGIPYFLAAAHMVILPVMTSSTAPAIILGWYCL